ncbi:MAG: YggT family protein [Nitrospirota bacterium]|nr:YggT family protein [Nitrospirota bacterium]
MFVVGNTLQAFAMVLNSVLEIYFWIVFVRVLISWVNPDPYNPIVQFLRRATDPLLNRVRRVIPPIGGLDFGALAVLLGIKFLQISVVGSLMQYARHMG